MLSIPPRPSRFDSDADARPTLDPGRPWWAPIGTWPADVQFTDVGPIVLDLERMLDAGRLAPPPSVGSYGCAAARCVDAPFAELQLDGPPPRRATVLRRGVHPLDRHPLRAARGAA